MSALASTFVLLTACTTLSKGYPDVDTNRTQLGFASWYGAGFDGRITANGERYAMDGFTAAHRTLPFGTLLVVTNLANQRQVQVRVNDRGPYIHGRILDLSYAAAEQLEMLQSGTSRIALTVMRQEDVVRPLAMTAPKEPIGGYIPAVTVMCEGGPESVADRLLFKNPRESLPRPGLVGDVWQRRERRLVTAFDPEQL